MAPQNVADLGERSPVAFQAWYGDKGGALALLRHPPSMRDLFVGISNKVDLPDTAPANTSWNPFIRGWPEGGHYLFSLTEPDYTAERPGMVRTRVLAFEQTELHELQSLEFVLRHLHSGVDYQEHVSIPASVTDSKPPSALVSAILNQVIHQTETVAIIGQDSFDGLVSELWAHLPEELRGCLSFSFSFTPGDLRATVAHIVAVPTSCARRWQDYVPRFASDWHGESSQNNQLIDQKDAFRAFVQSLGLSIRSFSDCGKYLRLWGEWQARFSIDSGARFALVRSLGTLIPDSNQAVAQKAEALGLAVPLLQTPEDILAQRSVKAGSFPDNASGLGLAVATWVEQAFGAGSSTSDVSLARVIAAIASSQSNFWQDWVRQGLHQACWLPRTDAAAKIWKLVSHPAAFAEVQRHISPEAAAQNVMLATFPGRLPDETYSAVEHWCDARKWLDLLGVVVIARAGFVQAIELILRHEPGAIRANAINHLCESGKPFEIWSVAFQYNDSTLLDCAVASALNNPDLWSLEVPDFLTWAEMLERAASIKPSFLKSASTVIVIERLFKLWEKGTLITPNIVAALASANLLNFAEYRDRGNLWRQIPSQFRTVALRNTLRSWLQHYYSRESVEPVLETELVQILFETALINDTFPTTSPALPIRGLRLLEKWGSDFTFTMWLNALVEGELLLEQTVAERAGKLVATKGWSRAAKLARYYEEARSRRDFAPIWGAFYKKLRLLERLLFDLQRSPKDIIHMESKSAALSIDAIILTALPEEFSAVREFLSEHREHTEQGTVYEIGRFDFDGGDCTVAVVQTGMGNSPTAALTERALSLFRPTYAFFVGIAGGLRDDLQIGDVVAADKVYGYEAGKAGSRFQPRPEATSISHAAVQRAFAVMRANLWQSRIKPVPSRRPAAFVKPIAAGEKILVSEDAEELKRVREIYSDAHAVAMEEHGFGVAIRGHPNVCFAVVRGISDLIENKADADKSGSHEIAARNAAAFAFEMLAGLIRSR